jgi:hypothetical protein
MADRKPADEQAAPAFVAAKRAVSALYARPRVERLAEAHAAIDRLWTDLTGLQHEQAGHDGLPAAPAKPRAVA